MVETRDTFPPENPELLHKWSPQKKNKKTKTKTNKIDVISHVTHIKRNSSSIKGNPMSFSKNILFFYFFFIMKVYSQTAFSFTIHSYSLVLLSLINEGRVGICI